MIKSFARRVAQSIAESWFLRRGKRLWEENQKNWNLPLTMLQFVCVPMEDVNAATAHLGPFDAVYVYEALHHAYDWQKACEQAYACLKPGGWFLMCNEPNLMHTFVAYRYSQLSKSPEIGFSKSEVFSYMEKIGFRNRVALAKKFGFYARPFWVAFQRPA